VDLYRTIIVRGWWAILLVLGVATAILGAYAPRLDVHAGTSVLLGERDPDLAYYEGTRPLWGYDEYAIVCATRPSWMDAEGVALLSDLVADLTRTPHARPVLSLLDVPLLRQEPGLAIRPEGLPTLRSPDVDLEAARRELTEHNLARGNLVSADGRSVSVLVYLDVPAETRRLDPIVSALKGRGADDADARAELERLRPEIDAAGAELLRRRLALVVGVRDAARRFSERTGLAVHLSGTSVISVNLMEHLRHDLVVFGVASFALFTLAFLLIYRRLRFVLLPMATCLVPVTLIVGALVLLDVRVTLITANLPLLLFTLMLPYTVYFVERYRERRSLFPSESEAGSTVAAAGRIWTPCLLSCTTTMAGFAALLTSDTRPVHDFGLAMGIGMALGLLVVFLLLPSLSRPLRAIEVPPSHASSRRMVRAFERLTLRAPLAVLAGSALLGLVAFWGTTRITAETKFTNYFRPGGEVHRGLEHIDREMGGTTPLEVMLEAKEAGHFLTPKGLDALAAVGACFDDVPETGSVRSLATLVDELKKKNERILPLLPLLARHPLVRAVTKEFATEDYRVARVLVRMRETAPTLDRNRILTRLRERLAAEPRLADLSVRDTGVFVLYANMLNSLIRTQRETFLYVVAAIWLMLVALLRSPVLALLVLLPQVLPALVMLGAMGWLGIPLDLVTVMIASIAMGVGVDAAIQYTMRYRSELAVDGDRRAALRRSHATIGRAIWIATSVIVAGFCVLALSDFRPSIWFGLFTAIAMLMSQVAALTTLPALFLVTGLPRRPHAPGEGAWR